MDSLFDVGSLSFLKDSLTWTIPSFFSLKLTVGREIRSPEFQFAHSRCVLLVWPRGMKGLEDEEWFGICLHKYNAKKRTGPIQFSILENGKPVKSCKVECSENGLYRNDKFMKWTEFQLLKSVIASTGCLTIEGRMSCGSNNMGQYAQKPSSERKSERSPYLQNSRKSFQCVDTLCGGDTAVTVFLRRKKVNQEQWHSHFQGHRADGFEWISPMQNSQNKLEYLDQICRLPSNIPLSPDGDDISVKSLADDNSSYKSNDPSSTSSSISSSSSTASASDTLPKPAMCEATSTVTTITNDVKQPAGALDVCDNYKEMILGGQACDVTIKVDKYEFTVHSAILRTKSLFFDDMLENAKHNVICVEDCDAQVFEQFLLYVYSKKLKNPSLKILADLYHASNMYSVPGLRKLCIDCMKSQLSEKNVCDVIRIAKMHNETDLVEHATNYFAEKVDTILLTAEWERFSKENVVEANLLLIDVLKYRPYKKVETDTNNFREMVYQKLVSMARNPNNH